MQSRAVRYVWNARRPDSGRGARMETVGGAAQHISEEISWLAIPSPLMRRPVQLARLRGQLIFANRLAGIVSIRGFLTAEKVKFPGISATRSAKSHPKARSGS